MNILFNHLDNRQINYQKISDNIDNVYFLFEMGNLCKKGNETQAQQNRNIHINQPNDDYGSNKIRSTSSSALTFIPLNLIHQFKNLPNLYFLLICVLQSIPQISVTNGQPTTLAPLSCVILTVMVKDAYQQFCRFLKDREQNSRKIQILTSRGFKQTQWDQLQVGHVFKVKQDELIPCDAIVLKSSLAQNKCFIQTRSLDGQTNLKVRKAPISKYSLDNVNNEQLYYKRYPIQAEPPSEYLNNIKGYMKIQKQEVPISIDNTVLRGCYLRNCAEVICVALYVGSETKVIINSVQFKAKRSKMMAQIDKMVISIFIWQLMIALIVSLFNTLLQISHDGVMQYIDGTRFWMLVPSWWLMMTYFVPISLIVTMQMIKLFQGNLAAKDPQGYSRQYDCFVNLNNTSVNENLGQIRYVFTDKTGTLTKNQMCFKKLIVNGKKYGDKFDISKDKLEKQYPKTEKVYFGDSSFLKNLDSKENQDVLQVIYLCHDIYVDKKSSGKSQYNSSSPDQIALINFAKLCGKQFIGQTQGFIKIYDHHSKSTLKFQKLAFLEFSSDRKKMSVIVKTPSNEILMVTKGADSAIEKILKGGQQSLKKTNKLLEEYSIEGLRTLMLAKRVIPESEWKDWSKIYKKAQKSIQNREQEMDQAYKLIEKNLTLVGGTAVQDKLQDQVQDTIKNMKRAGIKFFILTGDKKQTAVNIGRSSGLVDSQARLVSYPEQYNEQSKTYKGEKIYLIDASGPLPELPSDLFHHQTICYRCTPIQKANIVQYVKQKSPQLTLAIGDGANDVNMITSADVGVGVKGKQGTQATRVADVSIGQFKFLQLITLYYGRQWYRKNARLACFNFFKNWYHVSGVIMYGAYSYFSGQIIYDIYAYELFNAFFAAFPIMVYAVYDEQYTYEQSKKFSDIYQPGLMDSEFNQKVYYQNITKGIAYGLISTVSVFMVLQDDILSMDGRTGYMKQSGAVLFFSIVLVVNLIVLVMSNGVSLGLILSVMFGILSYWAVYFVQIEYLGIQLKYSFYEEWVTPQIIMLHIILIFMFIFIELGYTIFTTFYQRGKRMAAESSRNFLVGELLGYQNSQSFKR